MLTNFKIKNFKSIQETTASFSKDSKPYAITALIGENSTGKTNILLALQTLRTILMYGVENKYTPHMLSPEEPTEFDLVFLHNNDSFKYFLKYNKDEIIAEKLLKNNNPLILVENKKLYLDKSLRSQEARTLFKKICNLTKSTINHIDYDSPRWIYPYLYRFRFFLCGVSSEINSIADFMAKKILLHFNKPSEFLNANTVYDFLNQENNIQQMLLLYKHLNIDIVNINANSIFLKSSLSDDDSIYGYTFEHDLIYLQQVLQAITVDHERNNKIMRLLLLDEPEGIKDLFWLCFFLVPAFSKGGVVCIDSLTQHMHPTTMQMFIRMFINKDLNRNNAQLIYTAPTASVPDNQLNIQVVTNEESIGTKIYPE